MELMNSATRSAEAGEIRCCDLPAAPERDPRLDEHTVQVLKALGHPVRLQILSLLNRAADPVCVCDIEQPFDIKQPTISHHLRILREAGLVDGDQRGTWVYYRVRKETLASVARLLSDMSA
jgi:ArsR family transcriptional regulator, arsenate/arsenite/antimonite-responsive transcriptional repressor